MNLFWKIFGSMLISFVVVVSSISYIISAKQISDMEKDVLEENKIIGSFLSKEIEVNYFESKWPFESLKKLSGRKEFLFWWIVRDDGTIHLADNTSFMKTYVHDYFPEIANHLEKETVSLNRDQNYGIFSTTLETGPKKWSFWFGFSLSRVAERKKEIIFLITAISLSSLVVLGVILYTAIRYFTEPIREITLSTEHIGKGDLTHRVRIKSKDELGQLAHSFNKMTDDLQKTTVSKDYVDNIIGSMIDSLIVVDRDTKIRTVNKATCELLGCQEEELMGNSIETIFEATEEIPPKEKILDKLIVEGKLNNYETYLQTKDGKKIPILFNGSVVKDKDGRMIRIVYTARDITERKRVEKALLEEKNFADSVINSMPGIFYLFDEKGRFLRWNRKLEIVSGYSAEEISKISPLDFFGGEEKKLVEEKIQEVFIKGESSVEANFLSKDGEKIPHLFTGLPFKSGNQNYLVGMGVDITERKQMEEILIRSEETAKKVSQENETIAEIGRIISSTLNIEEIYERFAEEAKKLIPFDRIVINTIDIEKGTVLNVYMAGQGITDREVGKIYSLEGSGNAEMVCTKSSLLIQTEDFDEYKDRFPMLLSTFQAGFRSIINVPLFSKKKIVGGLLLRSLKPYAYTDKDVRLAERVGNQIAGAIVNAQLFKDLQKAIAEVKQLGGLLPICSGCKKIRDDKGYWNQIEEYISDHSEAIFSHGLCPDCLKRLYPDL